MELTIDSQHIGIKFDDNESYECVISLSEIKSVYPDGKSFFINYRNYPRTDFAFRISYDDLTDYNSTGGVPTYADLVTAFNSAVYGQEEVSGGTDTPSAATYSSGVTIPAGAKSVTIVTDGSYAGNILGVAGVASTTYTWKASEGSTLAAIAVTRSAGTFTVSKVV